MVLARLGASTQPPLPNAATSIRAEELALFALVVCDGAFVQHHIAPETDVRRLFALRARALNALGAEILAEVATAS